MFLISLVFMLPKIVLAKAEKHCNIVNMVSCLYCLYCHDFCWSSYRTLKWPKCPSSLNFAQINKCQKQGPLKSKNNGTFFLNFFIRAKLSKLWRFFEICGAHALLGPVILLYSWTLIEYTWPAVCTVQRIIIWRQAGLIRGIITKPI